MRMVAAARDATLLAALASRFDVSRAKSSWHALRLVRETAPALVLVAPPYGVELLRAVRREKHPPPVVCILSHVREAEAALNAGAALVVTPPLRVDYIVDVIEAWTG